MQAFVLGHLVRLATHRLLPEHQALLTGPSAHQMQRCAALAAGVAAARCLAVDRDPARLRLAQTLDPGGEAGLEQLGIERREHAAQRVVEYRA